MKVSNLIELLSTAPDDAVVVCGERTETLHVVSKGENGNAYFDMMFIGVKGSPLVYTPIGKPTDADMPEWYGTDPHQDAKANHSGPA